MISLRLITTGLDDVHSVIGYEVGYTPGYNPNFKNFDSVLIQPPEGTHYSYEAMHDINGIAIPELIVQGQDRAESVGQLVQLLEDQEVLVWYQPFIVKFFSQLAKESNNKVYCFLVDLYQLAKQKDFNPPSYKLADVYEYSGADNLFDLQTYLEALPEPKRIRRV